MLTNIQHTITYLIIGSTTLQLHSYNNKDFFVEKQNRVLLYHAVFKGIFSFKYRAVMWNWLHNHNILVSDVIQQSI